MKCSAIKLHNRKDLKRRIIRKNDNYDPIEYETEEYQTYYFTFIRNRKLIHKTEPDVKITTLDSKIIPLLNTENPKWSKKTPRLKSKSKNSENNIQKITDDIIDDYDISFDVKNFLSDLENNNGNNDNSDNDSITYLEYDIHSDIEELILKTQKQCEENLKMNSSKKKRKKSSKTKKDNDDKEKRKVKKKLKKTIKFSLSKPQSPETEQVIRVDITSNISLEDFENMESSRTRSSSGKTLENHRKISQENLLETPKIEKKVTDERLRLSKEDEEFILLCKQLVISPKDR